MAEMSKKLYDLMDWAGIEELVYSESDNPHRILGPHLTEEGLLIQALIPTAAQVSVHILSSKKAYPMAVSYTHLDVYKRQAPHNKAFQHATICGTGKIGQGIKIQIILNYTCFNSENMLNC